MVTVAIVVRDVITGPLEQAAWDLYHDAFRELNTQALQRHLMYRGEFAEIAADNRISKVFAYDGDEIVGMAVVTNDLHAWTLIAPEAFQSRWPAHYNSNRIWYIGWAFTTHPRTRVYEALIMHCAAPARACNGMVFTDFCARRAADLPRASARIVRRHDDRLRTEVADVQEFHLWEFPA